MEPLAYEMTPGAHLGRAAPWTQALVLFPPREPREGEHAPAGCPFEACDRGICVSMPYRVPDANKRLCWRRRRGAPEQGIFPGTAHRRMPPKPRSAWGVLPTPAAPHVPWRGRAGCRRPRRRWPRWKGDDRGTRPLALLRYCSPNPVTSDSIDVPPGFLHHSPCHLCYDGSPVTIGQFVAVSKRSLRVWLYQGPTIQDLLCIGSQKGFPV
jgi:hypothetical protein